MSVLIHEPILILFYWIKAPCKKEGTNWSPIPKEGTARQL